MKKSSLLLLVTPFLSWAQSLEQTLGEVLDTNPQIQERLKNYNATKEEVTIAKSRYYPKLDLKLGVGYESTTRQKEDGTYRINDDGTLNNAGYSVYQNSLVYTQNIFEGFYTQNYVKEQEYRTLSAAYSYIEQVNKTSSELVQAYLEYLKNYELLATAQENVAIDEKILKKVKALYDSGLTTLSEVNKVESSLALARSNLVVQEQRLLDSSFTLEKIVGRPFSPQELQKVTLNVTFPKTKEEALEIAYRTNPSLLIQDFNIKLAQSSYDKTNAAYYPKIDVELSANYNSNLSAVIGKEHTYKGMLYLNYNFFNGFADSAQKQQAISKLHQETQIKRSTKRDVTEKLNLAWDAMQKLQEQQIQLQRYKEYSVTTLKLYAKEYDLGRRSLLDLLTAQNDFINAKAQLITSRYNILESKFRVLDAMGILVSTLMDSNELTYSKVNLVASKQPHKKDTLPILNDNDNDFISDDIDICDNSKSLKIQNQYGCFSNDAVLTKRYHWFLFDDPKKYLIKTTTETMKKFRQFLTTLEELDKNKTSIIIFGNAFDEEKTEEELYQLSLQRAQRIKEEMLDAGIDADQIQIIANGNHAKLFIGSEKKNNRIDIIVIEKK